MNILERLMLSMVFNAEGGAAGGEGGAAGGGSENIAASDFTIGTDGLDDGAKGLLESNEIKTVGGLIEFAAKAGEKSGGGDEIDFEKLALDPAKFEGNKAVKELLERKQYPSVSAALEGLVNQEKLVGSDTIKAPAQGETVKFFEENAAGLGVPEKADGYELPKIELPEGMEWDKGLEEKARAFAHENHIPNDLFAAFAGFVMQDRIDGAATSQSGRDEAAETAMKNMRAEWKGDTDKKIDLAQQAQKVLDPEFEFTDAFDAKGGSAAVIKHFAMLGDMLEEGQIQLGDGETFGDEKSAAIKRKGELKGDPDFQKRLTTKSSTGHKEAKAEWARVQRLAAGLSATG